MRKLIATAATALALLTTAAAADETPPARPSVEAASDAKIQYNIWFCAAVRRGYVGFTPGFYFAASQPFPAGSGQGQQARYYAQQQALGQCGPQRCVADCYVQRFNI